MSAEGVAYLDSSAFVKLVAAEAESEALKAYVTSWPTLTSSALLRVEGLRAARRGGPSSFAAAQTWLARVSLLPITDAVLDNAALISTDVLRSLDAIHLASAMRLGTDLGVIVTYDRRMADAARLMGYQVAAPS